MKRLLFVLAALFLCAATAHAQTAPLLKIKHYGTQVAGTADSWRVLTSVAANASAANRTITLDTSGYSTVSVWVDVTEGGTISAVTLTCSAAPNAGRNYGRINSTSVSGGIGTVVNYTDSYATSTSDVALFEYYVARYDRLKCVVAITGGGASDFFTVYATAAAGQ